MAAGDIPPGPPEALVGLNTATATVHASCVALGGRAVLILGPSGSGKSALALSLMAFGARLVSDDRVALRRDGPRLIATAPEAIRGLIEARGVGLLRAEAEAEAVVALAVDLARIETARLPQRREIDLLGHPVVLLPKVEALHFPAAILQYLKAGRRGDDD